MVKQVNLKVSLKKKEKQGFKEGLPEFSPNDGVIEMFELLSLNIK